jgi:uncharacterized membrane protein (GlpM family)
VPPDTAPLDAVWLALLVKVLGAALVVVLASFVAERAGPFFGGVIATLPVSTGPAYVILAVEHDDRFIAATALSSLASNAAMITFLVLLVRLAPYRSLAVTLGVASAVWIALAAALQAVADWTVWTAVPLVLAFYALAFPLARRPIPELRKAAAPARWYDMPLRALLVGVLVATVTSLSRIIGPAATGIGAIYPIALSSLVVILHLRLGGAAVAAAMRSALITNPGFFLCILTLHLLAEPAGRAWALTAALAVSLAWALGVLVWKRRLG